MLGLKYPNQSHNNYLIF